MDKIKPLFTATATATGGRNGHSESSDGVVAADLYTEGNGRTKQNRNSHTGASVRRGLCRLFGGALDFVAKQHKEDASKAKVTCAVSIGPREGGGFGLAVSMGVEDKSLAQQELKKLVEEAHAKICPYSHATRGNVDVTFEVVGG